jgi:hypothetical protein
MNPPSTLPAIQDPGTRSAAFAARLQQVLGALAIMNPAIMCTCDLFRFAVLDNGDYPDEQQEILIRLGENIPACNLEHEDKFLQEGVGLIRTRVNWVILPAGFNLEPDDHILIRGVPYMITEAKEEMGVCRATISQPKNRFVKPARGGITYRQMGIGCFIQ